MFGDEKGQGLVEYALILVLVAVVVVAILLLVGPIIDSESFRPIDTRPKVKDDLAETAENTPVTINVLLNDPDWNRGFVTIPSSTEFGGTIQLNAAKNVIYEPAPGFVGHDKFDYKLTDNDDPSSYSFAEVIIAVGDVPIARPDKGCVNVDTLITINLIDNDAPGSIAINPASIRIVPPTSDSLNYTDYLRSHGKIQITNNYDGTITYQKIGPIVGTSEMEAEFKYTFKNSNFVQSNEGRITIQTKNTGLACLDEPASSANLSPEMRISTTNAPDPDQIEQEAVELLTIYFEQLSEQDAKFAELYDLGLSSLDTFFDLFLNYAENSGDSDLIQKINTVQEALAAGNIDYLYTALPELVDDINVLPQEMKEAFIVSAQPTFIDFCLTLSAARVPPESFYGAGYALTNLEAVNHGLVLEPVSDFVESWEQAEERHQFIVSSTSSLSQAIMIGNAVLTESGDDDLIAQAQYYEDLSRPCGIGWADLYQAINDADISGKNYRKSLLTKVEDAEAAYNQGFYRNSGETLRALLNQIQAQDGKHIDSESAEFISDTIFDLAAGLAIPLKD